MGNFGFWDLAFIGGLIYFIRNIFKIGSRNSLFIAVYHFFSELSCFIDRIDVYHFFRIQYIPAKSNLTNDRSAFANTDTGRAKWCPFLNMIC